MTMVDVSLETIGEVPEVESVAEVEQNMEQTDETMTFIDGLGAGLIMVGQFFVSAMALPVLMAHSIYTAFARVRYFFAVFGLQLRGDPRKLAVMTGNDAYFAIENSDHRLYDIAVFSQEGILDVATLRDFVWTEILNRKTSDGKKMFPKLTWSFQKVGGRYVWIDDKCFDINYHIMMYPENVLDTPDMDELIRVVDNISNELEDDLDRPRWRIYAVRAVHPVIDDVQFEPRCSGRYYVIFKYHRSYMDGISFFKVLSILTSQMTLPQDVQDYINSLPCKTYDSVLKRTISNIKAMIGMIPYFMYYSLIEEKNPLRSSKLSGQTFLAAAEPFAMSRIDAISKASGASIEAVVTTALVGAIRKYFLHLNVASLDASANGNDLENNTPFSDDVLPKSITVTLPVSLHDGLINDQDGLQFPKLENRFPQVCLCLPFREGNSLKRLRSCQSKTSSILKGHEPQSRYAFLETFANDSPGLVQKLVSTTGKWTLSACHLPGPQKFTFHILSAVQDALFVSPAHGSVGVSCTFLSYSGYLRIALRVDSAVIKDVGSVKKIASDIIEELKAIETLLQLNFSS